MPSEPTSATSRRALGTDGAAYTRALRSPRQESRQGPARLSRVHARRAAAPAGRGAASPCADSRSAQHLARRFRTEEGRALVAGTAAHSMLPLTAPLSGVFPRLFTALGAPLRLARRGGRQRRHRRRARSPSSPPGRTDRDGAPGEATGRAAARADRRAGRHAAPAHRHGGRRAAFRAPHGRWRATATGPASARSTGL